MSVGAHHQSANALSSAGRGGGAPSRRSTHARRPRRRARCATGRASSAAQAAPACAAAAAPAGRATARGAAAAAAAAAADPLLPLAAVPVGRGEEGGGGAVRGGRLDKRGCVRERAPTNSAVATAAPIPASASRNDGVSACVSARSSLLALLKATATRVSSTLHSWLKMMHCSSSLSAASAIAARGARSRVLCTVL